VYDGDAVFVFELEAEAVCVTETTAVLEPRDEPVTEVDSLLVNVTRGLLVAFADIVIFGEPVDVILITLFGDDDMEAECDKLLAIDPVPLTDAVLVIVSLFEILLVDV